MNKLKEKLLKKADGRYTINIYLFAFTMYTVFILLNDYICYLLQNKGTVFTYIIAFIITIILILLITRVVKVQTQKLSIYDIVAFTVVGLIMLVRLAIPDNSFDTLNYHLYMQERPFANNVDLNFFPCKMLNSFSYALADRMHYFFRAILGYRLGMILNPIVLMIIYFQSKRILEVFIKTEKKFVIPLLALLVIATEQLLSNAIVYYVDLLAIPFVLEMLLIILEKKGNKFNNYLLLFMAGVVVCLKLSNLFIVAVLAIIYIYHYYKTIDIRTILFGGILFLFPIAIYAINAYIQTGNPVFPFYNGIFGSPYLPRENWIEDAYGPKTMLERIFWPIYTIVVPRRAFDTDIYYGRLGFGYIAAIILVLYSIYIKIVKKEKMNASFFLALLYIVLSLLWSNFMMGYIRYVLYLEVIAGIVLVITIYQLLKSKKIVFSVLAVSLIGCSIYQLYFTFRDMLFSSTENSWRNTVLKDYSSYRKNISAIFSRPQEYTEFLKGIDYIGIVDFNSGYAALLNNSIPVVSLNYEYGGYPSEYTNEQFEKLLKDSNKRIFILSTSTTIQRTINYLNTTPYMITGEIRRQSVDFLNRKDTLYLLEVTQRESIEQSNVLKIAEEEEQYIEYQVKNNSNAISFYYGNYPDFYNTGSDGFMMYIEFLNENDEILDTHKIEVLQEQILTKYEKEIDTCKTVRIYYKNEEEKAFYNDWLTILNFESGSSIKQ